MACLGKAAAPLSAVRVLIGVAEFARSPKPTRCYVPASIPAARTAKVVAVAGRTPQSMPKPCADAAQDASWRQGYPATENSARWERGDKHDWNWSIRSEMC